MRKKVITSIAASLAQKGDADSLFNLLRLSRCQLKHEFMLDAVCLDICGEGSRDSWQAKLQRELAVMFAEKAFKVFAKDAYIEFVQKAQKESLMPGTDHFFTGHDEDTVICIHWFKDAWVNLSVCVGFMQVLSLSAVEQKRPSSSIRRLAKAIQFGIHVKYTIAWAVWDLWAGPTGAINPRQPKLWRTLRVFRRR